MRITGNASASRLSLGRHTRRGSDCHWSRRHGRIPTGRIFNTGEGPTAAKKGPRPQESLPEGVTRRLFLTRANPHPHDGQDLTCPRLRRGISLALNRNRLTTLRSVSFRQNWRFRWRPLMVARTGGQFGFVGP
jgi:hypothetical protein